jgi:hypothetical protein
MSNEQRAMSEEQDDVKQKEQYTRQRLLPPRGRVASCQLPVEREKQHNAETQRNKGAKDT